MLLPSQQSDLPGRDLIDTPRLFARREGTFLVLASLFVLATLALPLWFASSWIVELTGLPIIVELTIGVLVFPLALVIGQLVCELYGPRRAGTLVIATTVLSLAVIGGEWLTVGGYPLALALALVVCTTVTNAVNILVFAIASRAMDGRALFLRSFVATPVALLAGWSAFTLAWIGFGLELDDAIALASAPCLYACACALVGALPLLIARRGFGAYLRIGGREAPPVDHFLIAPRRLPQAMIVDDEPGLPRRGSAAEWQRGVDDEPALLRRTEWREAPRLRRPSFTPFNTGEMRFFAEGDELSQALPHDTLV